MPALSGSGDGCENSSLYDSSDIAPLHPESSIHFSPVRASRFYYKKSSNSSGPSTSPWCQICWYRLVQRCRCFTIKRFVYILLVLFLVSITYNMFIFYNDNSVIPMGYVLKISTKLKIMLVKNNFVLKMLIYCFSFIRRETRLEPSITCSSLNDGPRNGKKRPSLSLPDHRSAARLRIDPKVLLFVETMYSRLGRDIAELLVHNRIK